MGRRPKGLFATVREAIRAWWRSRYDNATEEDTDAAWPDTDQSETAAPRKKVFVQSLVQKTPLSVAAQDGVFSFEVFPVFRWSSREMSRDTLTTRVRQHEEAARDELLRVAWSAARACDPADPVAAEHAINARLATDGNWCFDDAQGFIRCTPSVRVRMDPAVREHVLPYRLDALTLRETEEVGGLRAERTRKLTEAWLKVISELELLGELDAHQRRLLVPFGAALADPDFRKVMEALRRERRTSTEALVAALKGARGDHQEAGLYEFADAYDKALSAFCREMGLSPFSWVDDAVAPDGSAR
ncbi:hypothetical protein LK07_13445 [Streptomyces pluripotens]|uniref:Uncharacterized protein n=1 Tax=Streptomyces pluripotens TaxID=1355015 RepID=A0A221NYA7_9ACTN|nr:MULTISPECIES: hypothetical protein [Streptomyces]ASN24882.1 hypothetical protein LK07_13445 [Streptomyces pluripotens]MCH0556690.1 hypothetical protein [Streptomyces sp. MUM 16J]